MADWTAALATLAAANAHFRTVLGQVRPEQLDGPTPCPDWQVRDLLAHVSVGNRWAALLMQGAEPGPAMGQAQATPRTGELLADFDADTAAQAAAFAEEGAVSRTVHHFIGDVPAWQFLGMRTGDVLVHTWDLARAVGADEQLPAPLVQAGLAMYGPRAEQLAATGMFGRGAEGAPEPADDQQRLLHLTGRRP
jgi:uncharacterized protein (TIGR03086 family)